MDGPRINSSFALRLWKFILTGKNKWHLADIYLFKVNKENTVWDLFKINNKGTRATSMTSGAFIINFEHILYIVLVFPMLTSNK